VNERTPDGTVRAVCSADVERAPIGRHGLSDQIFAKLDGWTWNAAVVGLGYIGLPLLLTQARAGIDVIGFDTDEDVVATLTEGRSNIDDVTDEELAEASAKTRFTTKTEDLRDADVIFVCVPTPLAVGKQPDVSHIEHAARDIASVLRPGHVVILESTTYPGTTETLVRSILESSGLSLDKDFLLAYSPERIDPGNASFRTANIPRIVGGASENSTRAAELVYRRFVEKVTPVKNARTAEMAKLLENTFRWVNIALANEMGFVARAIDVDVWEVIEAAATKPFGFMPFYPGPGVGGHCIPLDPFYLQWAARLTGEGTRFVELAEAVNSRMPQVVVARVQSALNEAERALKGARILILGVAYKPNVRDHRESPALEVIDLLLRAGAEVSYSDPHVPELREGGLELDSTPVSDEALQAADCVLVLCDHDGFDYPRVLERARRIVDTRNAFARRGLSGDSVHKL
jgi:UDP-N-acetyl-D-glucosamine dehydrogenase